MRSDSWIEDDGPLKPMGKICWNGNRRDHCVMEEKVEKCQELLTVLNALEKFKYDEN